MGNNKGLVTPDRSWIEQNIEEYFCQEDFKIFQKISGVDFRDLISDDVAVVEKAQLKIVHQSRLYDEIRLRHSGFMMPLKRAGFCDIRIYDDANYPDLSDISDDILNGIDVLPSTAYGRSHPGTPVRIPDKEILDKKIGYNWIAIGYKRK